MKLAQRILRILADRIVQHLQCLISLFKRVLHHTQVAHEHRVLRVDPQGLAIAAFGQAEPFLLGVNSAHAKVGVVVARVDACGVPETLRRLLQLLRHYVLVAKQRVGIGKLWVHLNRPLEELYGRVVLFVERKAVARHAPGYRRIFIWI